jgi:methylenetetrahydrofolate reductase (NADPH)
LTLDTSIKDEAFELGAQWAKLYEHNSPSQKLISEFMDTSFLVNVVHNDFHDADAIFRPFYKAGAEYLASKPKATAVNGH